MSEVLDDRIAEYFEKEENLHSLRQKLLNLDDYRLKSEIDDDLEKCKTELQKKTRELQDFKFSVEEQLKDANRNKEELTRWQESYGELEIAYQKFAAFSEKHRTDIAGIFGGCATPMDFLYGSVQKGHIAQLWDYVKSEIESADIDEHEATLLKDLFDFSFCAVNRSQNEPLYRRLEVSIGFAFDGDTMCRTATSPQLGRVKKLKFAGFAHEVTENVVRQSLVELE